MLLNSHFFMSIHISLVFTSWPPPYEVVIRAEPELSPGDFGMPQGDIMAGRDHPATHHQRDSHYDPRAPDFTEPDRAPRVPFEKVQSPHRYLCSFSRAPSLGSPLDLSSLFFWIYFVKCIVSPCCIFSLSHSVLGWTRSSPISTKKQKQKQNKTQF